MPAAVGGLTPRVVLKLNFPPPPCPITPETRATILYQPKQNTNQRKTETHFIVTRKKQQGRLPERRKPAENMSATRIGCQRKREKKQKQIGKRRRRTGRHPSNCPVPAPARGIHPWRRRSYRQVPWMASAHHPPSPPAPSPKTSSHSPSLIHTTASAIQANGS